MFLRQTHVLSASFCVPLFSQFLGNQAQAHLENTLLTGRSWLATFHLLQTIETPVVERWEPGPLARADVFHLGDLVDLLALKV